MSEDIEAEAQIYGGQYFRERKTLEVDVLGNDHREQWTYDEFVQLLNSIILARAAERLQKREDLDRREYERLSAKFQSPTKPGEDT